MFPRRIGPHRIRGGSLRGARIVTSWHDYPAGVMGRTERGLLAWFQQEVRAGDTWLDIGAHYGYTAIALSRQVGAAGRVFAFEPVTATAGCVAQTRRLNNLSQLTVVPLGLGKPESLISVTLPLTGITWTESRSTSKEWSLMFFAEWNSFCGAIDPSW